MKENLITIGIAVALGAIVYYVVDKKEKSNSNFSSACGCGA